MGSFVEGGKALAWKPSRALPARFFFFCFGDVDGAVVSLLDEDGPLQAQHL